MAFDPFVLKDVAKNADVPADMRDDPRAAAVGMASVPIAAYRFAYVASFTQSFVQVIDLDQRQSTFENVVFTLGKPTFFGGSSAVLVVTFLNMDSASVRASFSVLGRRGWSGTD